MNAVSVSCSATEGEESGRLLQVPVAAAGHSWQVWNAMVKKALQARRHHEVVTVSEKGQLHNLGSAFHSHLLSELGKSPKQRAIMNFSQESKVRSFLEYILHICILT